MIEIKGLQKLFNSGKQRVTALDDIDLKIEKGEFLLIKGPSGCGKSTLLFCMGGLLKPTAGAVRIAGEELYSLSDRELRRYRSEKAGFVFQSYYLLPYLTVAENIALQKKTLGAEISSEAVIEIAQGLHIDHRLNHKPGELSIGERQRVSLARVLMVNPDIMLADEPTGNLDPENAAEVLRYLHEYQQKGGTVVMVTHGAEADAFATRQITMKDGKIV